MSVVEQPVSVVPDASSDALPATPPLPSTRIGRLRAWLAHTGPEYRVGTLAYTRLGLISIFFWLLWGDLCWTLMERVYPDSMPLQLDRLGLPKSWIGYMMGTAGAIINMSFVPIISFRSDRTRTRWGRRIPYLLLTMPVLCVFLVTLGFSDQIGAWLKTSSWPARLHLSPIATVAIVMGALILLYDVFNVFVNSIFWYLFRDVIPTAFLARFMAAFRMVGMAAAFVWWTFFYGKIETHTPYIYGGAALLYFFGFGMMCLMVKEGEYPPPEVIARSSEPWLTRVARSIRLYCRQCFSHPLFVIFYLSQALIFVAGAGTMYKQFFYVRHLGFSLDAMGKVNAILLIAAFLVQLPLGWLVDKIHPMRGYLIAITAGVPIHVAGFFTATYTVWGYTIQAFAMFVAILAIQQPVLQLREASEVPLQMRLFPRSQYGQFSSANAFIRHFSLIFGTAGAGMLMGWLNQRYGDAGNAYAFLWLGGFNAVACIGLWTVFFLWRRYGAEKFAYEAEEARGFEVKV